MLFCLIYNEFQFTIHSNYPVSLFGNNNFIQEKDLPEILTLLELNGYLQSYTNDDAMKQVLEDFFANKNI